MKRKALILVVLAIATALPALAQSVVSESEREAIRGVPDKWGFSLGGFWQTFNTKVRLNGETSTGTEINFESDLGLAKNITSFQLSGFYRFGDHARLDLTIGGTGLDVIPQYGSTPLRGALKSTAVAAGDGSPEALAAMKEELEAKGKKVTGAFVAKTGCQVLGSKVELKAQKEAVDSADAILVMSCGAGTQAMVELYKRLRPGEPPAIESARSLIDARSASL